MGGEVDGSSKCRTLTQETSVCVPCDIKDVFILGTIDSTIFLSGLRHRLGYHTWVRYSAFTQIKRTGLWGQVYLDTDLSPWYESPLEINLELFCHVTVNHDLFLTLSKSFCCLNQTPSSFLVTSVDSHDLPLTHSASKYNAKAWGLLPRCQNMTSGDEITLLEKTCEHVSCCFLNSNNWELPSLTSLVERASEQVHHSSWEISALLISEGLGWCHTFF